MKFSLDHVHMRCQDLEATIAWYGKMFGGEVLMRSVVRGMPLVRVKVGDVVLAMSPARDDEPQPHRGLQWGAYELGFLVEDVHAAYAELEAKGAEFLTQPMEVRPGVEIFFLKAPDGMKIEILHRR